MGKYCIWLNTSTVDQDEDQDEDKYELGSNEMV